MALAAAGCRPPSTAWKAAAAAGQLEMCDFLEEAGCRAETSICQEAAGVGQCAACKRLLYSGDWDPTDTFVAYLAAARGGHVDLMEEFVRAWPELLARRHRNPDVWIAVAEGCDLATLQQLRQAWLAERQALPRAPGQAPQPQPFLHFNVESRASLLAAAASSPTSDWQAKAVWLEGQGCHRTAKASMAAALCPDAASRLSWLRQRGYLVDSGVARPASQSGNLAALQSLHADGIQVAGAVLEAARHGHLPVVAWMVETPGIAAPLDARLFNAAATSGSLELLAWLCERGCPFNAATFADAASGGNDVVLAWLKQLGCPMGDDGAPYKAALAHGDLHTLRCLRRLGCPWGPAWPALSFEVALELTAPELIWLLTQGPGQAEARARSRGQD